MSYKIVYTEEAEKDLISIYRYITINLSVPETAKKQVDRIMASIKSLDELPQRHKLYQGEPWHSVFYLVIEEEKTTVIIRIMYGGRNIELELLNTK